MKKRKKVTKLWVALTLFVSLVTVQTMQIMAEASTGNVDISNPSIVVSSLSELQNAVENAEDGDVIGIDSVIIINVDIGQLGSMESGKHLYLVRMNENAYFDIARENSITFSNMTIEGNKSQFIGSQAMFYVEGRLSLNNVTVQNCSNQTAGGAVFVDDRGSVITDNVVFDGNSAYQGGHIYSVGVANLNNSILRNGTATLNGGAVTACGGSFLYLTGCRLYGNSASSYGGAISNSGNTNLNQSIVFGNTASAGADIANDMASVHFEMDSLPDIAALYEAEGITPIEWIYDCSEVTPDIAASFNSDNPNSLLKLVYEDHHSDSGDTGNGDDTGDNGDDTGNTGDDANNTEGDTGNAGDNAGNTGEDTDNAGNSGNNGDNTEDKGNTGDNGGDTGNGNTGAPNATTASNEGKTQTTNNTDSHENKSTTSTTTNNYYTYNTPVRDSNDSQKQSNSNSAVAVKEVDAEEARSVSDDSATSANMQIPDNIKLNLYNVDIVYEMTGGISNIEVSNEKEETAAVAGTSGITASAAVLDNPAVTDEGSLFNGYEIVKMILLAAILIVVIPKPAIKKKD